MKETVKETFRISSDKFHSNLTKFSHNLSDKLSGLGGGGQAGHCSRMSTISTDSMGKQSTASSDEGKPNSSISGDSPSPPQSILQAVAFKAIPCVEAQVSPP